MSRDVQQIGIVYSIFDVIETYKEMAWRLLITVTPYPMGSESFFQFTLFLIYFFPNPF